MNKKETEKLAMAAVPHYLSCCSWSSLQDESEDNFEEYTFSDRAKHTAYLDLCTFISISQHYLYGHTTDIKLSAADIGHNLWLDRAGHGAGFWDRGFVYGNTLTKLAQEMGQIEVYLSDKQEIEFD